MDQQETRDFREQLKAIELHVGALVSKHDQLSVALRELCADVKMLKITLMGDGDRPGVLIRLDRLEQEKRLRDRILWAGGSVLVTLLINTVCQWLR